MIWKEKKQQLSFFLWSTEIDNFTIRPIHLTSLFLPSFPSSLLLPSCLVSLGVFLLVAAAVFVCLPGQDLSVSNAEALVVLSRGLPTTDGTSVFCKTLLWVHEGDTEATQKLGDCVFLSPSLLL